MHRLAEVALGNETEVVADFVQRTNQHRDQVAVGEQQDQQAGNHRDDDNHFRHPGQAIDFDAGLIELAGGGGVKGFSAGAKGAAQRRRDVIRLGAIGFDGAGFRRQHLRLHAFIQQFLPGDDHLLRNGGIHRAWRHRFKGGELLIHVIQRLLHWGKRGLVRGAARQAGFHDAR